MSNDPMFLAALNYVLKRIRKAHLKLKRSRYPTYMPFIDGMLQGSSFRAHSWEAVLSPSLL